MEQRNTSNASLPHTAGNISAILDAVWPPVLVTQLVLLILLILLNGFLLAMYIFKRNLRTSFSVYIMALLSSNIFYGLTRSSLDVIDGIYGVWWTGERSCDLYLYSNWVIYAFPTHCHILITVNRLWAITYPISYRGRHTQKVAVALCALMAVYIHVVTLPGVILDAAYYRLPVVENGCYINSDVLGTYTKVNVFLIGDLSLFFVVSACPLLMYQKRKRTQKTDPSEYRKNTNPLLPQYLTPTQCPVGVCELAYVLVKQLQTLTVASKILDQLPCSRHAGKNAASRNDTVRRCCHLWPALHMAVIITQNC